MRIVPGDGAANMRVFRPPRLPAAGRMCPADYRYPPTVFDRPAESAADVLYVAGGIYGNVAALDAVERLAVQERVPATIVFNGDFHWFDAEPEWFVEIECGIARHSAMRGNIETEIARKRDIGAGCGCAYPEAVDDDTVRRSNDILEDLRTAADKVAGAAARLARLPMHLVVQIGPLRVAIVHGDATSLAGWNLTSDALDAPSAPKMLDVINQSARVDIIASTHTCLPVLRDFLLPSRRLTVVNNGAAGMPNFSGTRYGLVSRIATTPSPHVPVYGVHRDGVYIDAISVAYDHDLFVDRFLARWPAGSAAHASYFRRIVAGPAHRIALAQPLLGAVAN